MGLLVVTKKKPRCIHLCIDLRDPNKTIVTDSHLLSYIEVVFMELRGTKMFSTLELQSAYHQVILQEDSRDLTIFILYDGLINTQHFQKKDVNDSKEPAWSPQLFG